MNIRRINRYYFLRFTRLRGSPRALAGGTAIGVFVGLTPTIPFHTIMIIALALLTRTSAIAGVIISWIVCNPITYLPIYYFSAVIGNKLTPYELNIDRIRIVLKLLLDSENFKNSLAIIGDLGYETLAVLGIGGVAMALPLGVVSYYLALSFFVRFHKKRRAKRVLD